MTYLEYAYALASTANPPSGVNATTLSALAPHATSFAGVALRMSSLQLLLALVNCCTLTLPVPPIARYMPL
jgi:hypothetical protein